jgi:hypothetical protein
MRRIIRWLRRHRGDAFAVWLGLVAMSVCSTVGGWLAEYQPREVRPALDQHGLTKVEGDEAFLNRPRYYTWIGRDSPILLSPDGHLTVRVRSDLDTPAVEVLNYPELRPMRRIQLPPRRTLYGDPSVAEDLGLSVLAPPNGELVADLAISPDSRYLAVECRRWTITASRYPISPRNPEELSFWLRGVLGLVNATHATQEDASEVSLFDVPSGRRLWTLPKQQLSGFTSDSQTLVTWNDTPWSEAKVALWDLPPRKPWNLILGWSVVAGLFVMFVYALLRVRWRRAKGA